MVDYVPQFPTETIPVTLTESPIEKNEFEIFWNVINALLFGASAFFGAILTSGFTLKAIGAALIAAAIVGIAKLIAYWKTQEGEYSTTQKAFNVF